MNMDNANKWLTLAANLGVLVGIFIVIIEIQQTQDQLDAEISYNLSEAQVEGLKLIATDPYLAEIIVKRDTGVALSIVEDMRLGSYLRSIVFSTEYAWKQSKRGRYQEFNIITFSSRVKNDFWGMTDTWGSLKNTGVLDADFIAEVESHL